MEALTALSLASAVIQLVDFGGRVFNASNEIRKSATGLTDELVDLEATSGDLQALVRQFANASDTPTASNSSADKSLADLAKTCASLAGDLLAIVTKVKGAHTGKHGRWRTLRQALQAVLKDDEIRKLARRLGPLKTELMLRLIQLGRDEQSAIHTALTNHVSASKQARINNALELEKLKTSLVDAAAQQSAELKALRTELDDTHRAAEVSREESDRKAQQIFDAVLETLRITQRACEDATMCQKLIASLHYPEVPLRHDQISENYKSTYSWVLETAPFRPWLEHRGGIFWINGKAGSGKSTLMKYLSNNSAMQTVLRNWAGDKPLIIASFFFWASGWPMQRSREGLLRSLLCQILRQCPDLIPGVFSPERLAGRAASHASDPIESSWTYSELISVLNSIVNTEDVSGRFCFFVDGLDEYDGDQYDLIHTVAHLGASSSVKICVSSRPWNVFRKAYDEQADRFLVLQDLTKQDIDDFVLGTLQQDARFQSLAASDASASQLVDEIRAKAQGVFLWVFLVVRSLLRGLNEDDDFDILLQRLRDIPDTLEDYFKKMLRSVETIYQRYTARSLLIAVVAETPLPLLSYWYLQLDMQDPDYALKAKHEPLTKQLLHQKSRVATSNVNKWCRDLLESSAAQEHEAELDIAARQVMFLHRTVRDYLLNEEVQTMLWQFAGASFEPELVLVKIMLRHAKALDPGSATQHDSLDFIAARLMYNARLYELRSKNCCKELIIELEAVGSRVRPTQSLSHWTDHNPRSVKDSSATTNQGTWSILCTRAHRDKPSSNSQFYGKYQPNEVQTQKSIRLHRKRNLLAYAVEFDLLLFVEKWLQLYPSDIHKLEGAPLLYHALSPVLPSELFGTQQLVDFSMVKLLLEAGTDLNQQVRSWDGDTVWEKTIRSVLPESSSQEKNPMHQDFLDFEDDAKEQSVTTTSYIRRDFVRQDDYHIRQLFSPLSDQLGVGTNDKIQPVASSGASVEGNVRILELMLHHNADPVAVRRSEFRPMLPLLCENCQAILREGMPDGPLKRDGPPADDLPSACKSRSTSIDLLPPPNDTPSRLDTEAGSFFHSTWSNDEGVSDAIAPVRDGGSSRRLSRVDAWLSEVCSTEP